MRSFDVIQNECEISLNTVDSIEGFVSDVNKGRWDVVLPQVQQMKLPTKVVEDLYELVVLELLELREVDAARAVLQQLKGFQELRRQDSDRFTRLKGLCGKTYCDSREIWAGLSKEKRRAQLGHALSQEVTTAPPQRLLTLLSDALKW